MGALGLEELVVGAGLLPVPEGVASPEAGCIGVMPALDEVLLTRDGARGANVCTPDSEPLLASSANDNLL